MPRAKTPKAAAPSVQNSFRGFLNIDLNDEDKRIIKSQEFGDSDFVSFMSKKIDDGYKFAFSYDDYSHCFQVIGQFALKAHPDAGILVSGRGSTVAKAFKQWCYIVDRLIDGQSWSELLNRREQVEIDD